MLVLAVVGACLKAPRKRQTLKLLSFVLLANVTSPSASYLTPDWLTAFGTVGAVVVALFLASAGALRRRRNRPRLVIDYNPQTNHDEFTPSVPFYASDNRFYANRQLLRIKVKNVGDGIATNCQGRAQYVESPSGCQGPSKERKPLQWELGGLKQTIPPKVGAEVLNCVFSDFRPINVQGVRCALVKNPTESTVVAYIAHPDNLVRPAPPIKDAFCYGNFIIEIVVICDEGVQETVRFLLEARNDALSMTRIPRP